MARRPHRIFPAYRTGVSLLLALCPLGIAPLYGQMAAEGVGKGEFPGLQLLPPGSVLRGISLPRYEEHRVTALFTAERMEVKSRNLVLLKGVHVQLYDKEGGTTNLETADAHYDFSRSRVTSPVRTSLVSPRMEAEGMSLVFDAERQVGLLKGPVVTAIRSGSPEASPTHREKSPRETTDKEKKP